MIHRALKLITSPLSAVPRFIGATRANAFVKGCTDLFQICASDVSSRFSALTRRAGFPAGNRFFNSGRSGDRDTFALCNHIDSFLRMHPDAFKRRLNPLGKGFDPSAVSAYLRVYIQPEKDDNTTPDLRTTLPHFKNIESFGESLRSLGTNPLCLICGCSSPYNGQALKQFLSKYGISPDIHAIDVTDFQWVFGLASIQMEDVVFKVEDAAATSYGDSSVDVVVQDFLLNCSPHRTHEAIMKEVARILSPDGIALISITDDGCVAPKGHLNRPISYRQLRALSGIEYNPDAYSIREMAPEMANTLINMLRGRVITSKDKEISTLVTATGNFEFFRHYNSYVRIFKSVGLKVVGHDVDISRDRQNLDCVRHRLILKTVDSQ